MNIDDRFRDLAPLDPSRDPERWERMVGGIARSVAPELARRAQAPDLLLLLSGWVRPTVSAAAALAAAAAAVLVFQQAPAPSPAAGAGLSDALGYPDAVAGWVESDSIPSLEELVLALEGDGDGL